MKVRINGCWLYQCMCERRKGRVDAGSDFRWKGRFESFFSLNVNATQACNCPAEIDVKKSNGVFKAKVTRHKQPVYCCYTISFGDSLSQMTGAWPCVFIWNSTAIKVPTKSGHKVSFTKPKSGHKVSFTKPMSRRIKNCNLKADKSSLCGVPINIRQKLEIAPWTEFY